MHYAYMWNGFLLIGFLLANQSLTDAVVTPQNQYFPANSERMSVHCLESGCIGKYTHLGPRDFPQVGILHPSALEIALGLRPRAISRASGCKIPVLGKSLGPRGVYFPIHPSFRQCTDTISIDILVSGLKMYLPVA